MRRRMRWSVVIGGWVCGFALVGCGDSEVRHKVYPVSGKLLVNGVPAAQAEVNLHLSGPSATPNARPVFPSARVQEDGSFRLMTYLPDDGAPEGEYKVLVTWRPITIEGGEEVFGSDKLQNRFIDPSRAAATVTIQAGDNQLPPIDIR